jgi:hypothetical protein
MLEAGGGAVAIGSGVGLIVIGGTGIGAGMWLWVIGVLEPHLRQWRLHRLEDHGVMANDEARPFQRRYPAEAERARRPAGARRGGRDVALPFVPVAIDSPTIFPWVREIDANADGVLCGTVSLAARALIIILLDNPNAIPQ